VQLPRLVTLGPRLVLTIAEHVSPGAVANARTAAATVAQQVADRRRLDPEVAGDGPGALSRLSRQECQALLATRAVGRLAYVARAGVPDIVPVNYALNGEDVLVRSGVGPKLQAAERGDVIAFQVGDVDESTNSGWSVVVIGPARRLTVAQQRALPDGALPRAWANGPRHALIRLRPTRVDGRRLR